MRVGEDGTEKGFPAAPLKSGVFRFTEYTQGLA